MLKRIFFLLNFCIIYYFYTYKSVIFLYSLRIKTHFGNFKRLDRQALDTKGFLCYTIHAGDFYNIYIINPSQTVSFATFHYSGEHGQ